MNKCEACGHGEATIKIRYNYDHGYCSGTNNMMICEECDNNTRHMDIGETLFVRIGNKLFYEMNQDYGLLECYAEVTNYEHFEYLKNHRRSVSFLNGVKWKY